ncbi:MAG: GNAT family N-acetyltransferase [Candidatus Hodarchaeales archaeon]
MIKELGIDNYTEIVNLWHIAGLSIKEEGRDSFNSIKKQLSSGNVCFFGYFIDDMLVGIVLLSHDSRKGWINRLAVHPDYQRKGIATQLIKKSEEYFKGLGLEVYCALIESDNSKSMGCFSKSSWSPYDGVVYFTKRISDKS